MGAGWVQISDTDEVILDTMSIKVFQWPSSKKAELIAIWTMLLTIPSEAEVIVYTDSAAAIYAMESGFSLESARRVQKQSNFL